MYKYKMLQKRTLKYRGGRRFLSFSFLGENSLPGNKCRRPSREGLAGVWWVWLFFLLTFFGSAREVARFFFSLYKYIRHSSFPPVRPETQNNASLLLGTRATPRQYK